MDSGTTDRWENTDLLIQEKYAALFQFTDFLCLLKKNISMIHFWLKVNCDFISLHLYN